MKVLIVEDNRVMRELLSDIAAAMGHEIEACGDAESAWKACQRDFFPLILLDWLLPEMDGLQFCQRIRALPEGDRSVVLVITSRDESRDLQAVLAAGADDYISKPVEPALLKVRLSIAEQRARDLLRGKQAEDQLQKSHNDLLSILDQLQVGTAITDKKGHVTFLNQAAQAIFAPVAIELDSLRWDELFPFAVEGREKLQQMITSKPEDRSRVSTQVWGKDGRQYWMNIDVRDDPRDAVRKVFYFYDMSDVYDLRRQLSEKAQYRDLVGKSKPMQEVYQLIQEATNVDWTVLIEGETGTGKELVARAIHFSSHRCDKPFIAVNCAALTDSLIGSQLFGHKRGAFTGAVENHKGFIEAADGGTLLLDEIGDIPLNIQASLLRVLQDKEFTRLGETAPRKADVRILAATHRDLGEEVAAGRFRQDLLYRLRIVPIVLPPLRQRQSDIPLLVAAMLRKHSTASGKEVREISQDSMRLMVDYRWPGNVRELENAIEYALFRCKQAMIRPEDLPPELRQSEAELPQSPAPPVDSPGAELDERTRLLMALQQTGGNRKLAAQTLGISRATLYRRLEAYDIRPRYG